MPNRKRKPKISYPTEFLEKYPGHRSSFQDQITEDPFRGIRRSRGSFFEERETLSNIPLSAFQHEPFQKTLDTLEAHFHIMWDDDVSIEHGRRRRRKVKGQSRGYGTGVLYKTDERFGRNPYTIYASGQIVENFPDTHEVQLRYTVFTEDPSSYYRKPYTDGILDIPARQEQLESRWDVGDWKLYIDGTEIPQRQIEQMLAGGSPRMTKQDLDRADKDVRKLELEGIKELDWD